MRKMKIRSEGAAVHMKHDSSDHYPESPSTEEIVRLCRFTSLERGIQIEPTVEQVMQIPF